MTDTTLDVPYREGDGEWNGTVHCLAALFARQPVGLSPGDLYRYVSPGGRSIDWIGLGRDLEQVAYDERTLFGAAWGLWSGNATDHWLGNGTAPAAPIGNIARLDRAGRDAVITGLRMVTGDDAIPT